MLKNSVQNIIEDHSISMNNDWVLLEFLKIMLHNMKVQNSDHITNV